MYDIYVVENKQNGKKYVGQTRVGFAERWVNHLKQARRGNDSYFCAAIRKHGPESFSSIIVATVDSSNWADYLERMWILMLGTTSNDRGYNLLLGGGGGLIHTDASKEKISARLTGRKVSEVELLARRNRVVSVETRIKLSLANSGKGMGSDNSNFGRKHSPETLEKIRAGVIANHIKRGNIIKGSSGR